MTFCSNDNNGTFRLDHLEHQRPSCHRRQLHKLLVLDPLVCLHAIDENIVAEVAPVPGYLAQPAASPSHRRVTRAPCPQGAAHEGDGQGAQPGLGYVQSSVHRKLRAAMGGA
jgi:hypothetical protein